MNDCKAQHPVPKGSERPQSKAASKTAELSADDLDKVSGGINPQPIPPGKNRVSQ